MRFNNAVMRIASSFFLSQPVGCTGRASRCDTVAQYHWPDSRHHRLLSLHGRQPNLGAQDLAKLGYVEEEFIVSGSANVYDWVRMYR